MDPIAFAGRTMLAVAGVLALAAMLLALPSVLRVRRRGRALATSLDTGRVEVQAAVTALRERAVETGQLLLPWRRLWRLSRHPLVVAAWSWHRRRRRRSA